MKLWGYEIGARVIAIVVVAAIVVALLLWGPAACRSIFANKKQAEVSKGQAGASISAGAEATNTLGNVAENAAAADAAVAQGQGEVRAAPEGQKGSATVSAACRFKANRDKPQCKEPAK
jgi:hypothetical protein